MRNLKMPKLWNHHAIAQQLERRTFLSGAGSMLVFTIQPIDTNVGAIIEAPLGVEVSIEDISGNVVVNTDTIAIALRSGPGGGSLSGRLTAKAVSGVATFPNLSISSLGRGNTLVASDITTPLILSATSSLFNVEPQLFTETHAFTSGPTAQNPLGNLVRDTTGNLFGTTASGGLFNYGTIFELSGPQNSICTTLVSFSGSRGAYLGESPQSGLIADTAGNLFGTTEDGGPNDNGTVFELAADLSTFSTLINFTGTSGAYPGSQLDAGLTFDSSNNLYGTTYSGGMANLGTVFELAANHTTFTSLVSFTGTTGSYLGSYPESALAVDTSNNLYGTTNQGGSLNNGTIFQIPANHTTFNSLVSFTGTTGNFPGQYPIRKLAIDGIGNLIGVTEQGGAADDGTLFELAGDHITFTSLIAFTGTSGNFPGSTPEVGVTFDTGGNIFGTTEFGGNLDYGTVYELSANHTTFTSLISFSDTTGNALGNTPDSPLTIDSSGNLYGTTNVVGIFGYGTVFMIPAANRSLLNTLFIFNGGDGLDATGTVVRDSSGNLFGTTEAGGLSGDGSVYELAAPDYTTYTTLISFTGQGGSYPGELPVGGLAIDANGNLFGTTEEAGSSNFGTVFELAADHTTFHSLVSFTGNTGAYPGREPDSTVTLDPSGNIYGTTRNGGALGIGTVFEIAANHTTFFPLVSFTGTTGPQVGSNPAAGLVIDTAGNIYGVTELGGTANDGALFELAANHTTFTTLVSFTGTGGNRPGLNPLATLTLDSNGNLFGTTGYGGSSNDGTIFELAADHTTFSPLISFTGASGAYRGQNPSQRLTFDNKGDLFGTTIHVANFGPGSVFELASNHTSFCSLLTFSGQFGAYPGFAPTGSLTYDNNSSLFAPSVSGGAYGGGTLYKIDTRTLPTSLFFTSAPTNTVVNSTIASPAGVQVTVENAYGLSVITNTDLITLTLFSNPGTTTLAGPLSTAAVNGVASFSNLTLSNAAAGYSISATDNSAPTLPAAISNLFTIVSSDGTTIAAGNTITLPTSSTGHSVLVTNVLNIAGTTNAWTGKLDITNNDADILNASLTTITNQVKQGFNGGLWTGLGIASSAAGNDSKHLTSVAVIQNNQSGSPLFNGQNLLDGSVPGSNDVLLKYTYYGDTNLDGKIDGSDYSRVDSGYLAHATGWFNGDFNYDGVINGSDYTLIDNAFNTQSASLAALLDISARQQHNLVTKSSVSPAIVVQRFIGSTQSSFTVPTPVARLIEEKDVVDRLAMR